MVEAQHIGFPIMLKSTAGGGIGMQLIWSEDALQDAYARVDVLAGQILRIVDQDGNQAADTLIYNSNDPSDGSSTC